MTDSDAVADISQFAVKAIPVLVQCCAKIVATVFAWPGCDLDASRYASLDWAMRRSTEQDEHNEAGAHD